MKKALLFAILFVYTLYGYTHCLQNEKNERTLLINQSTKQITNHIEENLTTLSQQMLRYFQNIYSTEKSVDSPKQIHSTYKLKYYKQYKEKLLQWQKQNPWYAEELIKAQLEQIKSQFGL